MKNLLRFHNVKEAYCLINMDEVVEMVFHKVKAVEGYRHLKVLFKNKSFDEFEITESEYEKIQVRLSGRPVPPPHL